MRKTYLQTRTAWLKPYRPYHSREFLLGCRHTPATTNVVVAPVMQLDLTLTRKSTAEAILLSLPASYIVLNNCSIAPSRRCFTFFGSAAGSIAVPESHTYMYVTFAIRAGSPRQRHGIVLHLMSPSGSCR